MSSDLTPAKEYYYIHGWTDVNATWEKKKGALYIDTQKSVKHLLGKFLD